MIARHERSRKSRKLSDPEAVNRNLCGFKWNQSTGGAAGTEGLADGAVLVWPGDASLATRARLQCRLTATRGRSRAYLRASSRRRGPNQEDEGQNITVAAARITP